MSYCRFSEGDVYLYGDVSVGWTCCRCNINSDQQIKLSSRLETMRHLEEHVSAGDDVPMRAFEQLRWEAENPDKIW